MKVREKAVKYGVNALSDDECVEFLRIKNLSPAHIEAMRRIVAKDMPLNGDRILSSRDTYERVKYYYHGTEVEIMLMICLSGNNRVLAIREISVGGMAGTVCDPRIVFKTALGIRYCTSIILAHNHPSGQTRPSQADIALTRKVREVGKHLTLELLDHIIVTGDTYYSFADEGQLD